MKMLKLNYVRNKNKYNKYGKIKDRKTNFWNNFIWMQI